MPLPSRGKSFLAATWALGEGGNGSDSRGGAELAGAGRGDEGPGGAGRGRPRGQEAVASLRVPGVGLPGRRELRGARTRGGRPERRARGACGVSRPPSPLPARRRSTQGALA